MKMISKKIFIIPVVALVAVLAGSVLGAMTGGTYKIDSDSINAGGIDYAVSGDNQIMDTLGEIATGHSTSTNFLLSAGYRQTEESSISLGVSSQDIDLLPNLGGLIGGTSTGQTVITVTTDNSAGYSLLVQAETSPALSSPNDSFADYSPAGAVPDYNFILSIGESVFAFTPEGVDIVDRYRDDGASTCGIVDGVDSSGRCWDGLSTSTRMISSKSIATSQLGATTTLVLMAGIGANRAQVGGTYFATTTITAVAL
jgi:hypothetical protein